MHGQKATSMSPETPKAELSLKLRDRTELSKLHGTVPVDHNPDQNPDQICAVICELNTQVSGQTEHYFTQKQ